MLLTPSPSHLPPCVNNQLGLLVGVTLGTVFGWCWSQENNGARKVPLETFALPPLCVLFSRSQLLTS